MTMDFEDLTDTAGNPDSNDKGPNRLKSIEAKKGGDILTTFSYGYVPNATLCGGTSADTALRHTVTDKEGVPARYCYDALGRLTKAENHNGANYDWTLDPNGNITKVVKGSSTRSFGYDVANRLCWQIGSSQASAGCSAPAGATTSPTTCSAGRQGRDELLATLRGLCPTAPLGFLEPPREGLADRRVPGQGRACLLSGASLRAALSRRW